MKKAIPATAGYAGFDFWHIERLSNDKRILSYARRINRQFLKQHKTDLEHLDSEYEAIFITHRDNIAAIVVFGMIDDKSKKNRCYYVPIVYIRKDYRGLGLYGEMMKWLVAYAKEKGASTVETDVMSTNTRMINVTTGNWEQTYQRFRIKL
jgi:GNAT superfamily N-acetyltransferase